MKYRDHGDISYEQKEVGDEIECFDGLKIKQGYLFLLT